MPVLSQKSWVVLAVEDLAHQESVWFVMTQPTDKLTAQIEGFLKLDKQRTQGEWFTKPTPKDGDGWATCQMIAATASSPHNRIFAQPKGGTSPAADQAFIAASANQAADFARKLKICVEGLAELYDWAPTFHESDDAHLHIRLKAKAVLDKITENLHG